MSSGSPLLATFGRWSKVGEAVERLGAKAGDQSLYAELGAELEGQTCATVFNVTEDDLPSVRLGLLFRRFLEELRSELREVDERLVRDAALPRMTAASVSQQAPPPLGTPLLLSWAYHSMQPSAVPDEWRPVFSFRRALRPAGMPRIGDDKLITMQQAVERISRAALSGPAYVDISQNLLSDADVDSLVLLVSRLPEGSIINAETNHLTGSEPTVFQKLKNILRGVRFLSIAGNNVGNTGNAAFFQSLTEQELDRLVFMPEKWAMTQPLDELIKPDQEDRCRRTHATFYAWRRLSGLVA